MRPWHASNRQWPNQIAAGNEIVAYMSLDDGLALLGLYNANLSEVRNESCPRDALGNAEFSFMWEYLPGGLMHGPHRSNEARMTLSRRDRVRPPRSPASVLLVTAAASSGVVVHVAGIPAPATGTIGEDGPATEKGDYPTAPATLRGCASCAHTPSNASFVPSDVAMRGPANRARIIGLVFTR